MSMAVTTPDAIAEVMRAAIVGITPIYMPTKKWEEIDPHRGTGASAQGASPRKFLIYPDPDTIELEPSDEGIHALDFSISCEFVVETSYAGVSDIIARQMILSDAVQLKRTLNALHDPGSPGILLINTKGNPWTPQNDDDEDPWGSFSWKVHYKAKSE